MSCFRLGSSDLAERTAASTRVVWAVGGCCCPPLPAAAGAPAAPSCRLFCQSSLGPHAGPRHPARTRREHTATAICSTDKCVPSFLGLKSSEILLQVYLHVPTRPVHGPRILRGSRSPTAPPRPAGRKPSLAGPEQLAFPRAASFSQGF